VIACPHALGLAIPLVVAISTSLAASHGFLIRNREAFEKSRNLQSVIFDKTGTLTEGKFSVVEVISVGKDINNDELLRISAAVEKHSEHPIAKAIAESVQGDLPDVEEFQAIPGKGVKAKVSGKYVEIVSPRAFGSDIPDKRIINLIESGKTTVLVIVNNLRRRILRL